MAELWGIVIAGWVCSAIVGGIIGAGRNSAGAGILLGLLFGPLGAIAAFALDGRARCPQCGNRVETDVSVCPVCRAELAWFDGVVGTQSQVEAWVVRQQQARAAAAQVDYEQAEDAARQIKEFNQRLGVAVRWLLGAMPAIARAVFIVPIVAVDRRLYSLADESGSVYRALQVIWYVIVPTVVVAGLSMATSVTREQIPPVAREEIAGAVPVATSRPPADVVVKATAVDGRVGRAVNPPEAIAPQPQAKPEPPVMPGVVAEDQARPIKEPIDPFAEGGDQPAMDEQEREEPAPVAVGVAPRPAVIDGAEIAAKAARVKANEDRQRRISEIEKDIERLSKERRAAQDNERAAAARDAYDVRTGYGNRFGNPFRGVPGEARQTYKAEADTLYGKMRSLREEMNELKRDAAREQRP